MNQAILFSDNEKLNVDLQHVVFQAQCQGTLITCVISVKNLFQLNEQLCPADNHPALANESAVLALFETARFDIEDIAEQMIGQQSFAQDGRIYLSI